jgi:hypothetical protein
MEEKRSYHTHAGKYSSIFCKSCRKYANVTADDAFRG